MVKKNQRGITLVALVVTIIVLLILAGVSLNLVSGSNGILGRTTSAVDQNKLARIQEDIELAEAQMQSEYYEEKYSVGTSFGTFAEYAVDQMSGTGYITSTGAKLTISGTTVTYTGSLGTVTGEFDSLTGAIAIAGTVIPGTPSGSSDPDPDPVDPEDPTPASGTIASGTYTPGQEVVYNTTTNNFELMTSSNSTNSEHFYVVSDEGTKVNLLSKYCLLRDASAQTDKDATYNGEGTAGYGRCFSSINYWNEKEGVTYPYDLQIAERLAWIPSTDTADNNAIKAAKVYGTSKGGVTGRLMKKEEANLFVEDDGTVKNQTMANILFGKWTDGTQPTHGYLYWWLGAASYNTDVWYVVGGSDSGLNDNRYYSTFIGVRPVLEVSES